MTVHHIETTTAESILGLPPIQIRLHNDYGNLPAGISIVLPRRFALFLLNKRLAAPVADLNALADIELRANDLKQIGFTDELLIA
jgi:hypothetical protein